MSCTVLFHALPEFAIIGAMLALYALHRDVDEQAFVVVTGMVPVLAAGIGAADLLKPCTLRILTVGSAALLVTSLYILYNKEPGHSD